MPLLLPGLFGRKERLKPFHGGRPVTGSMFDLESQSPRVIGQVKDYIEGYREPKEDWEE